MGNQFAKMLAKREILVPHLDNWFAQPERFPDEIAFAIHPKKEKDNAFHPSSAVGCARLLYAKHMGHITAADSGKSLIAQAQKNFMYGHFYHAMLQLILVEELGFCTAEDVEKEHNWYGKTKKGNPFWARGFLDFARVNIPGQPEPVVVDIKTMNAKHFIMPQLPFSLWEKYEAQIQLYLDWEDLDTAILLGCEKDTPHRFKEFLIQRDKGMISNIYDHWEAVADALVEKRPPACTCHDPERCPVKELY